MILYELLDIVVVLQSTFSGMLTFELFRKFGCFFPILTMLPFNLITLAFFPT